MSQFTDAIILIAISLAVILEIIIKLWCNNQLKKYDALQSCVLISRENEQKNIVRP